MLIISEPDPITSPLMPILFKPDPVTYSIMLIIFEPDPKPYPLNWSSLNLILKLTPWCCSYLNLLYNADHLISITEPDSKPQSWCWSSLNLILKLTPWCWSSWSQSWVPASTHVPILSLHTVSGPSLWEWPAPSSEWLPLLWLLHSVEQ